MAINRVQMQSVFSMAEFMHDYGTEAQCETALAVSRWSRGVRLTGLPLSSAYDLPAGCRRHLAVPNAATVKPR